MHKHGLSGAQLRYIEESVWKTSDSKYTAARIVQQARYINELNKLDHVDMFPKIWKICEDGYYMEYVQEVNVKTIDFETTFHIMKVKLSHQLWPYTPDDLKNYPNNLHRENWPKLLRYYVSNRLHEEDIFLNRIAKIIDTVADIYQSNDTRPCLIHGDPTLANIMRSNDNKLLIIDPLPSRNHIPGYKEVDFGKMLQSALGWERMLDPKYPEINRRACIDAILLDCEDDNDKKLAWFWCLIHYIRILKYAKMSTRDGLYDEVKKKIYHIFEKYEVCKI